MYSNNQTLSNIDGYVKGFHVKPIQETCFYDTGSYYSNGINIEVQLSTEQYANLLKYGYSGKQHNVYFTARSNHYAHLYAASSEDINQLLEVISN